MGMEAKLSVLLFHHRPLLKGTTFTMLHVFIFTLIHHYLITSLHNELSNACMHIIKHFKANIC